MLLLKEWAVVCRALDRGEQILILRKGGLADPEQTFRIEAPAFHLLPASWHQERPAIKPRHYIDFYLQSLKDADRAARKTVSIRNFARVVESLPLTDYLQLRRIDEHHIWSGDFLRKRFFWGPTAGVTLLILRVYRLITEARIPMQTTFRGCRSWIMLKRNPPKGPIMPVLSDDEFLRKWQSLKKDLQPAPSQKSTIP